MQESPDLFHAYHEGFRVQSQTWKVNPVDLAIKWLQKPPKKCTVADFGCGDAKIAQTLCNTHTVHSFDLFAHNKWVTACNMANVPCKTGAAFSQRCSTQCDGPCPACCTWLAGIAKAACCMHCSQRLSTMLFVLGTRKMCDMMLDGSDCVC